MTKPVVEGERVRLREITEADLDERLLAWFRDEELIRYFSGSRRDFSRAGLLADIEAGRASGLADWYCIELREGDLVIGTIKVGPIVPAHKIADLVTFVGDRAQHGRGLASEAIRLANQLAFEHYDLRKLYSGMFAANEAAIRAYTRAGWEVEGRLVGHYWVDEAPMDRVLVGCFNPKYFPDRG